MPVNNPAALVEEFKKSGEFDRIRRELLVQFREKEEAYASLKARVEDIGRQRLTADQTLKFLPNHDFVQKELMQEIERYPIIERAVADVRIFNDATFLSNLDSSIRKTLSDAQGGERAPTAGKATPLPLQPDAPTSTKTSLTPNTDPAPGQPPSEPKPPQVADATAADSSPSMDLKPPSPSQNSRSPKIPVDANAASLITPSPTTLTTTTTNEASSHDHDQPSGAPNGTAGHATTKPSEHVADGSKATPEASSPNGPATDVTMKDVAQED